MNGDALRHRAESESPFSRVRIRYHVSMGSNAQDSLEAFERIRSQESSAFTRGLVRRTLLREGCSVAHRGDGSASAAQFGPLTPRAFKASDQS
jgi:hypothetical protein